MFHTCLPGMGFLSSASAISALRFLRRMPQVISQAAANDCPPGGHNFISPSVGRRANPSASAGRRSSRRRRSGERRQRDDDDGRGRSTDGSGLDMDSESWDDGEGGGCCRIGPNMAAEARKVKRRKTLKSQGKMEHGSSGGEPDGCKKGVKNGFFANWAMGVEIWKIRQIFCA